MEIETGTIEKNYVLKTDEQIKELALKLYRGEIFTSRQVDQHMIGSVFMPLMLMDELSIKQMILNEADLLYSEMKDAGPMSVNGYPMFFSFAYLNKEDTDKMIEKYFKIKETMDSI